MHTLTFTLDNIIHTLTGLTSSLDSLLNMASPASSDPIHAKEPSAFIDTPAPVSDQSPQKTTASERLQIKSFVTSRTGDQPIPLSDSSHQEQVEDDPTDMTDTSDHSETKSKRSLVDSSPQKPVVYDSSVQVRPPDAADTCESTMTLPDSSHQQQVKEDFTDMTDTTDHSKVKSEKSLTGLSPQKSINCDANMQEKRSSDTDKQSLTLSDSSCKDFSTKDLSVAISGQITSGNIPAVPSSTNEPYQVMLHCNDKLVKALSLDPQGIAEILLAKGLIPENIEAQMRLYSIPRERAAILVTTVRQMVEIAPKRFDEFINILSKQEWTKDIMEVLQSCISQKQSRKDAGVQAVSTDDQGSTDKEHKSSSDISSNGEDYTFPELNSQGKAELWKHSSF